MATLIIYDKNGREKLAVVPEDSSTHQRGIQEDNVVNLSFTHHTYAMLDVNDYLEFEGERFLVLEQYVPQQKSALEWSYSCSFYGIESQLKRGLMLKMVSDKVDDIMECEFSLTAGIGEHMQLIVRNINRLFNSTAYGIGTGQPEGKFTVDYSNLCITDALSRLAEETGTEWWLDGTTLNLSECKHGNELVLGYHQGLTALERTTANNTKFFTRLYPLGTTRNIDYSTYKHTRLQLPDGKRYVDMYADTYGVIEHCEEAAFSHIYPSWRGSIGTVRSEEITEKDKTATVYYFKDVKALGFTPEAMADLTPQIHFESGDLAGEDFEMKFDKATEEFTIIPRLMEDGESFFPNEILKPEVENSYMLWNIKMPEKPFCEDAEKALEAAVNKYMEDNSLDKAVYKATTDYLYIADVLKQAEEGVKEGDKPAIQLIPGQVVRLESDYYFPKTKNSEAEEEGGFRMSRITRVTRKVNNPMQAELEMSDVLSRSKISTIENNVSTLKNLYIKSRDGLPEIIKTWEETPAADTNLYSALKTVRSFVSRLYDDVVQGVVTFVRGIRFGNWSAGSSGAAIYQDKDGGWHIESDYAHFRQKLSAEEIEIQRTTHIGGKVISTAAQMVCSDVKDYGTYWRCFFKAEERKEGEDGSYKVANQFKIGDLAYVETFNLIVQEDGTTGNHFYWRRVVDTGENFIDLSANECAPGSTTPLQGDHIVQLGSSIEDRQSAIIQASVDGYIDLENGAPYYRMYKGISNFSLPEPVINISPSKTKITADSFVIASGNKDIAESMNELQVDMDAVKRQNDNMWVLWFAQEIPTLNNYPASEWETNTERDEHIEDIVVLNNPDNIEYNGRAWRFKQPSAGIYQWEEITDASVLAALETSKITSSELNILSEKVELFVEAAQIDPQTNLITQYDKSGLVTESNYVEMFSKATDGDGNKLSDAFVKTYTETVGEEEKRYIQSGVHLKGDQIILEGAVSANEKFKILTDGSMEAVGGTFHGKVFAEDGEFKGEIKANKGYIGALSIVGNDLVGYNENDEEQVRISMGNVPTINNAYTSKSLPFTISSINGVCNVTHQNGYYSGRSECIVYRYEREEEREDEVRMEDVISIGFEIDEIPRKLMFSRFNSYVQLDAGTLNGSVRLSGTLLYNNSDGTYERIAVFEDFNDQNNDEVEAAITRTGRYTLKLQAYIESLEWNWRGKLITDVTAIWITTSKMQKGVTTLAKDGILCIQNNDKYFSFSSQSGFEVRFGSYGLKIDNNGIQKLSNNSWSSL
ncbi:hypothetical protein D0T50_09780 [Bacteroides sp. 214]|uniref:hypothetical protein n=1 Tax=Bacteroides sp. 214 TaxID=2302935 RepID=UPI0013D20623|nr:hypothetical protein [Bacteroides sp. 214]NDW13183.1 hypothetical protein [Bacteroides sp. 214]